MPNIRPVSDLRNHFTEITNDVQASKEPVFLTKNGVGSLVVMSMEAYEDGLYESRVYDKLIEAELQAAQTKMARMYKIVYLPLAEEDILDAVDYIAGKLDAPKAAQDLLDELDDTVERISKYPYAHELYRTTRPMRDEIRKVPVKGYVLYYAVLEDTVEIRRFLHGRRDRQNLSF